MSSQSTYLRVQPAPPAAAIDYYAYVETDGNDATAQVGNPEKPFKTVLAANAALVGVTYGTIKLGAGVFSETLPAEYDNSTFRATVVGAGSDKTSLELTAEGAEGEFVQTFDVVLGQFSPNFVEGRTYTGKIFLVIDGVEELVNTREGISGGSELSYLDGTYNAAPFGVGFSFVFRLYDEEDNSILFNETIEPWSEGSGAWVGTIPKSINIVGKDVSLKLTGGGAAIYRLADYFIGVAPSQITVKGLGDVVVDIDASYNCDLEEYSNDMAPRNSVRLENTAIKSVVMGNTYWGEDVSSNGGDGLTGAFEGSVNGTVYSTNRLLPQ